jgi:hypothetical protein
LFLFFLSFKIQNSKFKIQIYLLYRDFLFYRELPLTEEISSKSPSRFRQDVPSGGPTGSKDFLAIVQTLAYRKRDLLRFISKKIFPESNLKKFCRKEQTQLNLNSDYYYYKENKAWKVKHSVATLRKSCSAYWRWSVSKKSLLGGRTVSPFRSTMRRDSSMKLHANTSNVSDTSCNYALLFFN